MGEELVRVPNLYFGSIQYSMYTIQLGNLTREEPKISRTWQQPHIHSALQTSYSLSSSGADVAVRSISRCLICSFLCGWKNPLPKIIGAVFWGRINAQLQFELIGSEILWRPLVFLCHSLSICQFEQPGCVCVSRWNAVSACWSFLILPFSQFLPRDSGALFQFCFQLEVSGMRRLSIFISGSRGSLLWLLSARARGSRSF